MEQLRVAGKRTSIKVRASSQVESTCSGVDSTECVDDPGISQVELIQSIQPTHSQEIVQEAGGTDPSVVN